MAVKTLKTKRVFVYAMWNNLRNTAPKDYPTTNEIKNTINEILPALKEGLGEYPVIMKKAVDLSEKIAGNEEKAKESDPAVKEVNEEWRKYNKEHGPDVVEVKFEGEAFKTLKDQFNRDGWGRKWIATVDEFGELLKAFDEVEG